MTKKVLFIVASLLELILLGAAYAVYYFADTRMGMARYVMYLNQKWEKAYPLRELILGAVILLGILCVLNLALFIRKRSNAGKWWGVRITLTMVCTAAIIFFALRFDARELRSYYQVLLILVVFCLLQNSHTLAELLMSKGSRSSPVLKEEKSGEDQ